MQRHISRLLSSLRREFVGNPAAFSLRVTVVLLAITLLLVKRSIWTPDTLLIIVLVIGVIFGRAREFIVRFAPFLGLLVVYDAFRSVADDLNPYVNYLPMIEFDRLITGGSIPTQVLQDLWWRGRVGWLDFYFYFIYTLHFLVPVITGLILWKWRPKLYWPFVWAFVMLSFAAFIAYVLFPAAPPWLAYELGYFGGEFHRISSDVWRAMGVENFSEVYAQLSPNQVAAVPSLHSAYPLLASFFFIKAFGMRKMWWILIYPLSMWVGVVYLGEHYIFDVIAAIVFVVGAYAASIALFRWNQTPGRSLRRFINRLSVRLHLKR